MNEVPSQNRPKKKKTGSSIKTFQPLPRKNVGFDAGNTYGAPPALPTHSYVALYPRISTPGQRGNVSSKMQMQEDGDLWNLARRYGWADELVIMYPDDMEISGTVKMAERPAFRRMLDDIINGRVKAVIAIQVDRLFRDRWGTEYSPFMEICEKYNVLVITPDMVYDFSNNISVTLFRMRCQAAWDYLEYQVHGKMHGAKHFLGYSGRWEGGNLPVGYYVCTDKKDANYRKFLVYRPHADILYEEVFKLFHKLGRRMTTTWKALQERKVLFPPFDQDIADPKLWSRYNLTKVKDEYGQIIGYHIGSVDGLRRILTNPVYVGWWIYRQTIVSRANHEPIIPVEEQDSLFWTIFAERSPYNIDGTPNLQCKNRPPARFFQQEPDNTQTILKPVLHAIDNRYYIVTRRFNENYMYSLEMKGARLHETKGFITTSEVDNVFWSLFLDKLTATDDIQLLNEQEEVDVTSNNSKETVLKRLDEEIEGCTKAGEKIKRRIVKLSAIINEDGHEDEEDEIIIALREQHAKLLDKKKHLETQRNMLLVQPDPAVFLQQKLTYRRVLAELRADTSKALTQQVKRELIKIFAKKVYIDLLAPRIFRLIIDWRDESWNITEMICLRVRSQSPSWSKEEDRLLQALYPVASIEEMLTALPNRALAAIRHRAHRLHIKRGNIYRFDRRENGHPGTNITV